MSSSDSFSKHFSKMIDSPDLRKSNNLFDNNSINIDYDEKNSSSIKYKDNMYVIKCSFFDNDNLGNNNNSRIVEGLKSHYHIYKKDSTNQLVELINMNTLINKFEGRQKKNFYLFLSIGIVFLGLVLSTGHSGINLVFDTIKDSEILNKSNLFEILKGLSNEGNNFLESEEFTLNVFKKIKSKMKQIITVKKLSILITKVNNDLQNDIIVFAMYKNIYYKLKEFINKDENKNEYLKNTPCLQFLYKNKFVVINSCIKSLHSLLDSIFMSSEIGFMKKKYLEFFFKKKTLDKKISENKYFNMINSYCNIKNKIEEKINDLNNLIVSLVLQLNDNTKNKLDSYLKTVDGININDHFLKKLFELSNYSHDEIKDEQKFKELMEKNSTELPETLNLNKMNLENLITLYSQSTPSYDIKIKEKSRDANQLKISTNYESECEELLKLFDDEKVTKEETNLRTLQSLLKLENSVFQTKFKGEQKLQSINILGKMVNNNNKKYDVTQNTVNTIKYLKDLNPSNSNVLVNIKVLIDKLIEKSEDNEFTTNLNEFKESLVGGMKNINSNNNKYKSKKKRKHQNKFKTKKK